MKTRKATFIAYISYNLFSFWLIMGMISLKTVFADIINICFAEI